jgi:hypothetical protein
MKSISMVSQTMKKLPIGSFKYWGNFTIYRQQSLWTNTMIMKLSVLCFPKTTNKYHKH